MEPSLLSLKQTREKGDLKSNLLPTDYRPGARYDINLPSPPKLQDRYVCNSRVLSDAKHTLAPWIWDACNVVLDHVLLDGAIPRAPEDLTRAREDSMERAVEFVDSQRKLYARRPEQPLQPASSIKALLRLRHVLEHAPLAPAPGTALWGTPFPGLEFIRTDPEECSYYEWDEEYLERVFSAACEVVEVLGTGRDGWRTVRWEVYDKVCRLSPLLVFLLLRGVDCDSLGSQYSQSPSFGFWYDKKEKAWIDNGTDWLDCRRRSRKELQQQGRVRSRCSAGLAFNRLLPSPAPSQATS